LGVGDVDTYYERMNGADYNYYSDAEIPYMEETYNTITYQEQIMMRVHALAGWSLGKGDSLRKVKHIGENTEMAERFFVDCKEQGVLTDETQI
jgi:DNA polymerase-3 subunit alpha